MNERENNRFQAMTPQRVSLDPSPQLRLFLKSPFMGNLTQGKFRIWSEKMHTAS